MTPSALLQQQHGPDPELADAVEAACDRLWQLFEGITVTPSLLHGDLWGGNWAAVRGEGEGLMGEEGQMQPVIYDPASYYGHSEAEIAIMTMFGAPGPAFFSAYFRQLPKQPGFEARQDVYQLYHYLNHYSIFGRTYRPQCMTLLRRLLG